MIDRTDTTIVGIDRVTVRVPETGQLHVTGRALVRILTRVIGLALDRAPVLGLL